MNGVLKIYHQIKNNPIQLYRAVTGKISRYPGKFWTENIQVAKYYSTKTMSKTLRHIEKKILYFEPFEIFDVSLIPIGIDESFNKWFNYNYPDEKINSERGPYLYEVLYNDQTDFIYPTIIDNHYLQEHGYKAVYFEYEGGEKVDTWYIPYNGHNINT